MRAPAGTEAAGGGGEAKAAREGRESYVDNHSKGVHFSSINFPEVARRKGWRP